MGDFLLMPAAVVFVVALLDAALGDLRRLRIANRVPLALLAAFPLLAMASGMGGGDWLRHLGTGVACFAGGAALFALGVWGGGDAKLLPAVALWAGPAALPRLLLVMGLAGGLVAVAVLARRGAGAGGLRPALRVRVPYGVAIAAGGLDWAVAALLPRLFG